MGRVVDFNYIFFGRHEKRHKWVTVGVFLLIAGIFIAYQFTAAQKTQNYTNDKTTREVAVRSFSICDKFKDADYNVSCNEAVTRALATASGTVENVEVGSVRTVIDSDPPQRIIVPAWLIDIRVSPYFDPTFKKEVNILRIGIGVNGNSGISKEVLA